MNPQEAAIYYVLSVVNSSSNFTELLRQAQRMRRTISQRALRRGRDYLLNKGFLARVLLARIGNGETEQKGYIPVHPRMVFNENESYLRLIYEPEDLLVRKKQIEDLYDVYEDNYGEYGLKMEEGCITLHYKEKWLASYITSIITKLKVETLSLKLGDFHLFKEPYRQYYEDKLEQGLKMRVLLSGDESKEELGELTSLRNEYEENVEIRYNPLVSKTSKSFIIDDVLAMDGKKFLLMDEDEELSCIGIMYVREECIENVKEHFEELWRMGRPIRSQ
ncbi:MAG: hypothetical protein ACXQTS_04550 [Candidatus Methanospirareceae archaeon]